MTFVSYIYIVTQTQEQHVAFVETSSYSSSYYVK